MPFLSPVVLVCGVETVCHVVFFYDKFVTLLRNYQWKCSCVSPFTTVRGAYLILAPIIHSKSTIIEPIHWVEWSSYCCDDLVVASIPEPPRRLSFGLLSSLSWQHPHYRKLRSPTRPSHRVKSGSVPGPRPLSMETGMVQAEIAPNADNDQHSIQPVDSSIPLAHHWITPPCSHLSATSNYTTFLSHNQIYNVLANWSRSVVVLAL